MIYAIIASTTFIAEMLIWLVRVTSRGTPQWIPQWMRRDPLEEPISWIFGHVRRNLERQNSDHWVANAREGLRMLRRKWTSLCFTDKLGLFLRALEITNSAWLAYIVCAQTFGSYRVRLSAQAMPEDGS